MKTKIIYICDIYGCGCQFETAQECEAHEANMHYHISYSDYLKWKQLVINAANAGKQVGICKNPKTDKAFDTAINELVNFEEDNYLFPFKRPTDWTK
jgi:hypothetical protein